MKKRGKRIVVSSIALLMAGTSTFGQVHIHAAEQNIAKDKEVYAVSTKSGTKAIHVTDGDLKTIWQSGNDWNRWVEIDLNGTYSIDEVKVHIPEQSIATFNVYVSDDNVNFDKVGGQLQEVVMPKEGYSVKFEKRNATKVRVSITFNNQSNLASINEVEIMGNYVSDKNPKVPEIKTSDFEDTEWADRMEARTSNPDVLHEEVMKESYALVDRILGEGKSNQFEFEVQNLGVDGKDAFSVEQNNGKIKIAGPNGISLASGFNWYLKNVAHLNYDPLCASNLNTPEKLPLPEKKISKETPYQYKYALNFCTFSYTMAFWGWEEYEAFLDWCAMNGINLMLDVLGQEEVQRRVFKQFGYTDQEIKEYITGPGYYAWFYMANMSSFGGPLPDSWFEQRTELARKVHDRMSIYGITPVFLGYAGQVPVGFEDKNPNAQVIVQGNWSGFKRPTMLRTYVNDGQDYFDKVADVYYEELEKVYGDITNYYAVDPFHEGGIMADLNLTKVASTVQNKMMEHNKEAIWVIQNWQSNPTNAFIQGLNKEQSLILDLYADNQPNHFNRNEYNGGNGEGTPWIWNMLHSFGGRMGFNGMPEVLASIPEDLAKSNYMAGIGVTAESLATNPMLYEMIYDMGWEVNNVNVQDYISNYFYSRYGVQSENIEKAWDIMVDTAYFKRRDRQRAEDSIINARPGFGVNKACIYYTAEIDYDKAQFEQILELYLKEYDNLKDNEAYLYDLADITRQVLANASYEYYRAFEDAWLAQDYETFKLMSDKFLEIIDLQDRVLSTQDEFLVGRWIDNARNLLDGADDWTKDLFEFNARAQISSWGGKSAANGGGLHDYSNRQWNGITGTLYRERWQTWINKLDYSAKNSQWSRPSVSADEWFEIEYKWASKSGNEFITEASNENLEKLASEALNSYSVTKIEETNINSDKENLALNKPATTNGIVVRPTAQAVDGNESTLWVNQEYPATLEVDLQGTYTIDGIDLYFERPAEDMSNPVVFGYKIEVLDENDQWKTVVDESDNIEIKSYVIKEAYKGKVKKVRVTIPTADLELRPLVKPGIAELYVWKANEPSIGKENLALNGSATASKTASNPERVASKVNDGKIETFWAAGTGEFPQWVQVDLGKPQDIMGVMIGFEKAMNDFKYQVDFYGADGKTLLGSIDQNNDNQKPQVNEFEKEFKDVQFVKVTINGVRSGSEAWPAVSEIQVFGETDNLLSKDGVVLSGTSNQDKIMNLIDGNVKTQWVASGKNKQILINLGHQYELNYSTLIANDNDLNYKVEISKDGKNFEIVSARSQNAGEIEKLTFGNAEAQYVRYTFEGDNDVVIDELILVQNDYTALLNSYIKKYEDKVKKVKVGEYSGQYLQSDYDAIMKIFDDYKAVDGSELVSSEFESIKKDIFNNYVEFMGKSIVVDKTNLLVQINESQLILDKYPEYTNDTSFVKLQNEVKKARDTYDKFEIKQDEVDATYEELKKVKEETLSTLSLIEQFDTLISIAEQAKEEVVIGEYEGNVPQEQYDNFVSAIDKAKSNFVSAKDDETKQNIILELSQSIETFKNSIIHIDRTQLKQLIEAANSVERGEFTLDTWIRFDEARTEAKNIFNEEKVTQAQIEQIISDLEKAYENLALLDKLELKQLLDEINDLDPYAFDGNSYQDFMAIVEETKALIDEVDINQKDLDNAVNQIMNRKDGLIVLNTDEANKLIEEVQTIDFDSYTENSVIQLNKALNDLKSSLYANNRNQETIDKMVKSVEQAITNLEKIEETEKPDIGGSDENDTNSNTDEGRENQNNSINANENHNDNTDVSTGVRFQFPMLSLIAITFAGIALVLIKKRKQSK